MRKWWWCCRADYPNHEGSCPNKEGKDLKEKDDIMSIQPIERLEQENATLKERVVELENRIREIEARWLNATQRAERAEGRGEGRR